MSDSRYRLTPQADAVVREYARATGLSMASALSAVVCAGQMRPTCAPDAPQIGSTHDPDALQIGPSTGGALGGVCADWPDSTKGEETTGSGSGESALERTRTDGALEPEKRNPNYSRRFLEFWDAYPRKTSKRTAADAFTRACNRALADEIITAAREFAETPKGRGEGEGGVPYPATWLNGDRWEDDRAVWNSTGNDHTTTIRPALRPMGDIA